MLQDHLLWFLLTCRPEPFLPLSLSRFKSKMINWIGKRKQAERRVWGRYGISQLFLEGPIGRYVQFVSKLDRKHCRMLIGLLTGHINLHYMLYKMRRAKTPLMEKMWCRKGNVGTLWWIPCFRKDKDADLGLALLPRYTSPAPPPKQISRTKSIS